MNKRAAARKKLKDELNRRKTELFKKLPGTAKMSLKDLKHVTEVARKLKW